jgi:glutathione S-transferase
MADDLVFYTIPMSRGQIARWMLEEVGQPYRTEILDREGLKAPAYLAVNPMGKVPAIRHGEVVVTEAAAICAYLADAFPQAGLAPAPHDPARGAYYRWLFFAAGPLETAVVTKAMGWELAPERSVMAGWGSFERTLDAVEGAVGGREHLAGERFSAADLYLGSLLSWGMKFGILPKRPAFETYVGGLTSRPAYARAAVLDAAAGQAAT